jgi:hypothetical protein
MTNANKEGLTFAEWLAAAGKKEPKTKRDFAKLPTSLLKAWLDGEDPAEYRDQKFNRYF